MANVHGQDDTIAGAKTADVLDANVIIHEEVLC
jgi:hypothetical protein